ncbi:unnamed protein product, partial [Prorocentrum cordatum]
ARGRIDLLTAENKKLKEATAALNWLYGQSGAGSFGALSQDLLAARPDIKLSGQEGKVLAPRLLVLPMGWNWSPFFCQSLVGPHVLQAGFDMNRQVADGKVIPDVPLDAAAATYVGGAAAFGSRRAAVMTGAKRVEEALLNDHLLCKGVEALQASQKFTGLTFDQETATISLSPARLWRLRLGLRELADRGSCSGDDLQVLGHFTWAALLRRGLLSIFTMSYKFADWAGPRRRRLWKGAITELRAASALIAFAFYDAKRVVDPRVLVPDASTGEGAEHASGSGGNGVAEKLWDTENFWAAIARGERWRYASEGAAQARALALGPGAEARLAQQRQRGPRRTGSVAGADFLQVDPDFLTSDGWKDLFFGIGLGPEHGDADQVPEGDWAVAHSGPAAACGSYDASSSSDSSADERDGGPSEGSAAPGGALNGLTCLQRYKVQEHAQRVFDSEFDALAKWGGRRDLLRLAMPALDTLVAQYLDYLCRSGCPSAKGSRVLAGEQRRSKTRGRDEGALLLDQVWSREGGQALRQLLARRRPGQPLWSFSRAFARRLRLAAPCQMGRGAASHARAVDRMPQSVLQERMRRGSAQSTLRYKKHVRYLKELEQVPLAIQQWTTRIERRLGPLLLGQERPPAPPFKATVVIAMVCDRLCSSFWWCHGPREWAPATVGLLREAIRGAGAEAARLLLVRGTAAPCLSCSLWPGCPSPEPAKCPEPPGCLDLGVVMAAVRELGGEGCASIMTSRADRMPGRRVLVRFEWDTYSHERVLLLATHFNDRYESWGWPPGLRGGVVSFRTPLTANEVLAKVLDGRDGALRYRARRRLLERLGGRLGEEPTTFLDWRGRELVVEDSVVGRVRRRLTNTGVSSELRLAEASGDELAARPAVGGAADGGAGGAGGEAGALVPASPAAAPDGRGGPALEDGVYVVAEVRAPNGMQLGDPVASGHAENLGGCQAVVLLDHGARVLCERVATDDVEEWRRAAHEAAGRYGVPQKAVRGTAGQVDDLRAEFAAADAGIDKIGGTAAPAPEAEVEGGARTLCVEWTSEGVRFKTRRKDRSYHELTTLVQAPWLAGTYDGLNLGCAAALESVAGRLVTIVEAHGSGPAPGQEFEETGAALALGGLPGEKGGAKGGPEGVAAQAKAKASATAAAAGAGALGAAGAADKAGGTGQYFPVPLVEQLDFDIGAGLPRRGKLRVKRPTNDAIEGLNWMRGARWREAGPSKPRLVTAEKVAGLRRDAQRRAQLAAAGWRRPSSAGPSQRAFPQLLRGHGPYGAETRANLASFAHYRLSIPGDVRLAPRIDQLLPDTARNFMKEHESYVLRSPGEAAMLAEALGPAWPCTDPALRSNRKVYAGLVKRPLRIGLVRLSASKKCDAGVFVVKKKDGVQQRLILDCRASNRQFAFPRGVSLLAGEGLIRGARLGASNVEDCFHGLRFPKDSKLDEYFACPEVWPSDMGLTWWGGERLPCDVALHPLAQTLPMGWAWGLYCAQELSGAQLLQDRGPPLVLRGGEGPGGQEICRCVGNLGAPAVDEDCARQGLTAVTENFGGQGLAVHEAELACQRGVALGVEVDGQLGRARPTAKRFWRARGSIQGLVHRGACSGQELEVLVGHVALVSLIRRGPPSILRATYRFARKPCFTTAPLRDSARQDLLALSGAMVFLEAKWDDEWLSGVYRADASPWGFGAAYSRWPKATVADAGRVPERARFRLAAEAARSHALAAAGLEEQEDGMARARAEPADAEVPRWERGKTFPELPRGHDARAPFVGDNPALTLALGRSRSRVFKLLALIRARASSLPARLEAPALDPTVSLEIVARQDPPPAGAALTVEDGESDSASEEVPDGADRRSELLARKRARRRIARMAEGTVTKLHGQSYPEAASVSEASRVRYRDCARELPAFADQENVALREDDEVDECLVSWMNMRYRLGDGVAGPPPWAVWAAFALEQLRSGQGRAGFGVLLMVDAYLREGSETGACTFPQEEAKRSQVGSADDTVAMNSERIRWADPALAHLASGPASERLFPRGYQQRGRLAQGAGERLGIEAYALVCEECLVDVYLRGPPLPARPML